MGIDVKPFTANIEVVINNDMLADKISKLQNELAELEAEKARLNSLISALQGENADLQAQIIQVDNKINQLTEEINALNGEVVENPSEYALGTKNAIANAIKGKGGTITEATTFREYANEINNFSVKKTGDPHTLLLMHFDESVTKDDSINDCRFTITGNPTITTEKSKFGGGSLYLDGASCLTFERNYFPFFTPDFTFEFWWYPPDDFPGSYRFCLFSQHGTFMKNYTGVTWECFNHVEFYNNRYYQEGTFDDSRQRYYTYGLTLDGLTLKQWNHVAIVRNHKETQGQYAYCVYVNGGRVGWQNAPSVGSRVMTTWNNYPVPWTLFAFKWESGGVGRYLEGYINDLRISDVCRYTSRFTPPTEPFTI